MQRTLDVGVPTWVMSKMAGTIWSGMSTLWRRIKTMCAGEKKSLTHRETLSLTDAEISEQAAFLCQKYIEDRFARANLCLSRRSREKQIPEATFSEDVLQTLCEMCKLLEDCHPNLFVNVLDQLNFRINLGILVYDMFSRVCENIISSGITWARIVALHSFAGALAHDFTQHGDTRFIHYISKWMAHFTGKHLCPWIRDNGGWVSKKWRLFT